MERRQRDKEERGRKKNGCVLATGDEEKYAWNQGADPMFFISTRTGKRTYTMGWGGRCYAGYRDV